MEHDDKNVVQDPFGGQHDKNTGEFMTPAPEKKEEGKNEDSSDESSEDVTELKSKLDEYSKNLSGQRELIDKLNAKIAELKAGGSKKDEDGNKEETFVEVPPELTDEQKEDMTEAEIRLYEQNRNSVIAMNKLYEKIQGTDKKVEEKMVEDLNRSAQSEALAVAQKALEADPNLAEDATELANKILIEFKQFDNSNITEEQLQERMRKALNLVDGYKPPKESSIKTEGAKSVKKGLDDKGDDPFGIDDIVSSVNRGNDGNYDL